MFGECHAHIFMNGVDYRAAVRMYRSGINQDDIRKKLQHYQRIGISFVRDGGDNYGASQYAATIAEEYGIDYRTPAFAIHKTGHYGKIVGKEFANLKEYHNLVKQVKIQKGDFIKIMISGIMDFEHEGTLTETSLPQDEIREMIHIAHEEGYAVMAYTNGADAILAAAQAGVDSIEHGNFADEESLAAMKEHNVVWVPTFVTISNLQGSGRFPEDSIKKLKERQSVLIKKGYEIGVQIALGSDAGAYQVPHGKGLQDEYQQLRELFGTDASVDQRFYEAERTIQKKFKIL